MRPRWAICVRDHGPMPDREAAPWRWVLMTEQPELVDQFRRGITSGPGHLAVLTLPEWFGHR